jgi:polyferredoxin
MEVERAGSDKAKSRKLGIHTMARHKESGGCLAVVLWPFVALWTLIATIIKLVGRLVALIFGLVLMIIGAVLTVTVVGSVVGVPLAVLGLLLVLRSLF